MDDIKFGKLEETYFNKIFEFCADDEAERNGQKVKVVSASKVKTVFLQSNVDGNLLKKVWSIWANRQKSLDQVSFFKALKWVSIIQTNGDLEDLDYNLKQIFDLPVFDNKTIQDFQADWDKLLKQDDTHITEEEEIKFDASKDEENIQSLKTPEYDPNFTFRPRSGVKKSETKIEEPSESIEITMDEHEIIRESYFSSYTQFKIVSIPNNIEELKSGAQYTVWRRFSDFEWFHNHLIEQDEYKGIVMPSLPEKSYFSKNDEKFIETRKRDLQLYLKNLADHKKVKHSKIFHLFLTMKNDEEFNNLKVQESTLKSKIFDYVSKLKNFDVDYLMIGITQVFDREEPEKFELKQQIQVRVTKLLEYEKQLSNIVTSLKDRCDLNDLISDSMSEIALSLEKFRLNSETADLDKLFLLGGFIEEEDIEDLDNIALSRVNSKDHDKQSDDYDKITRLPFKSNMFPTLKESSRVNSFLNQNWKNLYSNLKVQLAKIHGIKGKGFVFLHRFHIDAMERRKAKITQYKTNQSLITKKKLKQDSAYDYSSLASEIGTQIFVNFGLTFVLEKLESENQLLEKIIIGKILCLAFFYHILYDSNSKLLAINKDLSDDLTDLSLSEKIEYDVKDFVDKYRSDLSSELPQIPIKAP